MSYISEAAELFLSLNPNITILSPFDYLLLAEWEKQEIPLDVVLDAIRGISGKADGPDKENFAELKQEVKEIYAAWLSGARRPMARSMA